jgi:metallo-beta-lactamase family protein
MGGFSAHADQKGLVEWFGTVAPSMPRLIVTHGEDRARGVFSGLVESQHRIKAQCPQLGDVIEV